MTDLIEVLVTDHRRIETLFAELEAGAGDPRHRRDLVDVVVAEVVRHVVAEELYLYPVVRDLLPDGDRLADHGLRQDADLERMLDAVDATADTDLAAVIAAVRAHVDEQERDLFRRVRQACPPGRLADLGSRAEAAKRIAPTRPHPHVPGNRLGAAGSGLVDRVRDALTNRPTHVNDL